ncbi:MAG: hypothetical protein J6Y54_05635, partial [Lentisphaeria bacterium]|nr:hypothetical protein [Lentisphaeria bacterium]
MIDVEELDLRSTIERREATIRILERDLREARQKLHEMEQLDISPMFDIWSKDGVFGILCREMHEAKLK